MRLKNSSAYLYPMLLRKRNACLLPCFLLVLLFGSSCGINRHHFDGNQKYPVEKLQRDYKLFRNILEESHPSVHWFSPVDSMNHYFDWGYRQLTDSMTEPQFRSVLSYVIAKIKCGHTSTRYSRRFLRWLDTASLPLFPISVKLLDNDTVILNNTLKRSNVVLPQGTILTHLDGRPINAVVNKLKEYIPADGHNENYLRQTISNRGAFGGWLRLVEGLHPQYSLGYLDGSGNPQLLNFKLVEPPPKDSTRKQVLPLIRERIRRREQRDEKLFYARSIQIDTGLSTAYMTVNTFNNTNQLRPFFRNSFRELRRNRIQHLVVDIRSNGGGNVTHSNFLTRLLINRPFKLADSLYAVSRKSRFGAQVQYNSITGLFMPFITRRRADGKYHFGFFERHYFKPKKRNHYNGNVYVLIGPNSFSASAIFAQVLKGQKNITLIGEETGGGAYGNTAWFIPEASLPETGIRFRLPKFRLVMNKNTIVDGRGVLPDIEVKPTRSSVIQNRDLKVETVRELIISGKAIRPEQ